MLSTYQQKIVYPLGEQTYVVVWQQMMALCIDLGWLAGFEYPGFWILDDALVQLMKHIGGDGIEDVEVGRFKPEGLPSGIPTEQVQNIEEFTMAMSSRHIVSIEVTQICSTCAAPRAVTSHVTVTTTIRLT